jgi:hypothetical protein
MSDLKNLCHGSQEAALQIQVAERQRDDFPKLQAGAVRQRDHGVQRDRSQRHVARRERACGIE